MLFYAAELKYVGTGKTTICFGVTVQLHHVIKLISKQSTRVPLADRQIPWYNSIIQLSKLNIPCGVLFV